MKSLIIGHRGFIGSTLKKIFPEAMGVGKQEISAQAGKTFLNIYCAAPQAKKWWANKNPELDKQEVESLIQACKKIACLGSFNLFSTIDVYDPPLYVNELCSPLPNSHPYGRHRLLLEESIVTLYGEKARIFRLPALVGHGLKKNVIYDLINHNNVHLISPRSCFQWFNLDNLPAIIEADSFRGGGKILNVVSEPLETIDIVREWFPRLESELNWDAARVSYNVQTIHGTINSPYLFSAQEIFDLHLRSYIEAVK